MITPDVSKRLPLIEYNFYFIWYSYEFIHYKEASTRIKVFSLEYSYTCSIIGQMKRLILSDIMNYRKC